MIESVPTRHSDNHRSLLLMLLAATLLFTANMGSLSLLPLDDCFYARKGVEMLERGSFFDVLVTSQSVGDSNQKDTVKVSTNVTAS